MGNYTSRATNAEDAINKSLAEIETQNQDLLRRQRRHDEQIQRLIASARGRAAAGDRAGALVLLRRQQKFQEQSVVIGNMIETLSAHGRSLETKLITSETMCVMKNTAKQLSRNTLSLDAVDDFMVHAEESQAERCSADREVATAHPCVDFTHIHCYCAPTATAHPKF